MPRFRFRFRRFFVLPRKVCRVVVVVAKNDARDDADDGDERQDDKRRRRDEKRQTDVLRLGLREAVAEVLGRRVLALKRHRTSRRHTSMCRTARRHTA